MESGDIYRHERFYRDTVTGELKPKFLVFLAPTAGDDWVVRLLTSQVNLRTEDPPCSLEYPRPGFYLGILGGPLPLKTWVDLRGLDDVDLLEVPRLIRLGIMTRISALPAHMLVPLLECAAQADDTTRYQERALRDLLARMR
jgi:hypothetical protein